MASRYWIGGGTNANWNASPTTNWSATSGGAVRVAAPTVADDVFFDGAGGAGNSNATISATISCLSLTISAGYTSTMTHNAVLTIAGNWTMHTGYTIAGANGITISAGSTFTSGGKTWPNNITSNTTTKNITLVGDFTMSGTFLTATNVGTNINLTTTEIFTCNGLTLFTNGSVAGTAAITMTGGTWSSAASSGQVRTVLNFAGNVTVSGSVYCGIGCTINYGSGTITPTGRMLFILVSSGVTLNTNGMTWNTVSLGVNTNITITSNLTLITLSVPSVNVVISQSGGYEVRTTNLSVFLWLTIITALE